MSKHTPGPWKVWGIDSEGPQILSLKADIVARLDPWRGDDKPEMDANARLLAAAPMLLGALEATLPALVLLGNYIGNEWKGGGGIEPFDRCLLIERINACIAATK